MILQNILFPHVGICMEQEMYVRLGQKAHIEEGAVCFKKGATVQFDTYFNGFSIEKWKKYTHLAQLELSLKIKGRFKVTLCSKEKIHGIITEKTIREEIYQSQEPRLITVPFAYRDAYPLDENGMYYFALQALEKDCVFYGGYYATQAKEEQLRDITLGVVICTFRREKFVERNLRILERFILGNPENALSEHLHIYISDNGKTLDIERLSGERIHIYPNKNVGGAGGFTRGMIEILEHPEHGITHALMMDDDVVIEPESLFRTFTFLRFVKQQYRDVFIGGAMLRLDRQNIQVESGATWNAGQLCSLKGGLDLNSCEACLFNEVEEYTEFNAWWYCCIPREVIREDNLPLPIFIRGDDVEYGLRNMKYLVLLNGICVWHETFENKYSSFLEYYIVRNMLIDNACHCPKFGVWKLIWYLFRRVGREIAYYRYKNVSLIARAVKDFCKGVDWLKEQDGEKLHQEIMAAGYKAQPVDELEMPFLYGDYDRSLVEGENRKARFIRLITVNGLILKAKRNAIVSMALARPINFYRAKKVLQYDITSKKGFITEKSYRNTLRSMNRFITMVILMIGNYGRIKKEYTKNVQRVRELSFWKNYLDRGIK